MKQASIFAAYVDDSIIGMVRFIRESGQKDRHKGHIGSLFVEPGMRGRGFGMALLGPALDHAASIVEHVMHKVVTANVAAITLYERLGFQAFGIEPHALKSDGGYVDEILMIRFFNTEVPATRP